MRDLDVAEGNLSVGAFDGQKTKASLKQSTLSWNGGEAALQTSGTIDNKEKLQKWKKYLILIPVMVTSELTLEPISTAVGCVNSRKDQATQDALKNLLGCEIKFHVGKKRKSASILKEIMKIINDAIIRKFSLIEPDHSG